MTSCPEGLKEMYAWFHYDVKNTAVLLSKVIFFDTVSLKLFVLFVQLLCVIFIVLADPYSVCLCFFLWAYHLDYVLSFKLFFVFIVLLILDFLLFWIVPQQLFYSTF